MYAKNKPDTFIVYENNNKYCPKTKEELVENIKEFYKMFGENLPKELENELKLLESRLKN